MSICNLEYDDSHLKKSRSLWQYYRNEPITSDAVNILNFTGVDDSNLFKTKQKITYQTGNDDKKKLK